MLWSGCDCVFACGKRVGEDGYMNTLFNRLSVDSEYYPGFCSGNS